MENWVKKNTFSVIAEQFLSENGRKEVTKKYRKTGFHELDMLLGGGMTDGLYILAACPGAGKSTLALQMALQMVSAEEPVIYYSLEMPRERLFVKAVRQEVLKRGEKNRAYEQVLPDGENVLNKDIMDELVQDPKRWEAFEKAVRETEKNVKNMFVVSPDSGERGITAQNIMDNVEGFVKETGKHPIVIVDYLQFLSSKERIGDYRMLVDESVRTFSDLSRSLKIPLLLISSINRVSYRESITLQSLKESGLIEYSADVVLGIESDDEQDAVRQVELKILKNRYGSCGDISFEFRPAYDFFKETGRIHKGDRGRSIS